MSAQPTFETQDRSKKSDTPQKRALEPEMRDQDNHPGVVDTPPPQGG